MEYTVVDCFQQKFGPAVSINESSYAAYMTSNPVSVLTVSRSIRWQDCAYCFVKSYTGNGFCRL